MTAATKDIKAPRVGTDDEFIPGKLSFPVAAATIIYAGTLVAVNASGYAVPASSTAAFKIVGRCAKQADNTAGLAAAINVDVETGAFEYAINADSTIDLTSFGKNLFASDDNTLSLLDGNGLRPYAGYVIAPPGVMGLPTTLVGAIVGLANPYAANPEQALLATQYKARAVVTSLAANTVTTGVMLADANGALGTQDGVTTLVAGDCVFIQEGTTNLDAAKDAGPWLIDVLGTASVKFQLKRPDWWAFGAAIVQGAIVEVGGEGTAYPGTQWKCFAGISKVVGTDAPVFWPKVVQGSVALVAGTTTISTAPVRSGTKSHVTLTRIVANTSTNTVGGYAATTGAATGITPGVLGTAAVIVEACVAAGTINNADISTIAWAVQNW